MLSLTPGVFSTTPVPSTSYVLLVDDHSPSLRTLKAIIEQEGFTCLTATSSSDAIRLCDLKAPKVVVTDLAMPNLDGHGLARWLAMRFPSIPLILVTGETLDERTRAKLEGSFAAVYSKPVDARLLIDRLSRMMPPAQKRSGTASRP